MIQSMTGYASASVDSPHGALAIELRSVNSRFLDLQFRVAEEMRAAELMLREQIAARIARGKIDCRLSRGGAGAQAQLLNANALQQLRALAGEAAAAFPDAAPLRVADILRWPGVLAEPALDAERTRALLEDLCRRALDELCAARAREGARLAAILREVLEAGVEERVRAEIALFAAKSDVDEEITRLGAHLDEVERVLAKGGAAGKRLDFLAQELNREANTLASKAAGLKIADCALELKLLIEQIREQVQNIE